MRWFILIVACGILVLSGCKEEEDGPSVSPGADQTYFPMAPGNEWTWVGGLESTANDTIRWKVSGTVVRDDGKPAWKIYYERQWAGKDAIVDSGNVRVDRNRVLFYMDHIDPEADTVLTLPLSVGKKWYVGHVRSRRLHRRSVVAAEEELETPYGPFKSVLRVDTEDRAEDTDSLLQRSSEWYAPGVGRVMTRIEARGQVFEMKLLTAKLN